MTMTRMVNGKVVALTAEEVAEIHALELLGNEARHAMVRAQLRAYAADKRWRIETAGCAWGNNIVQTDRDSQSKLIAEFVALGAGLRVEPSPWKFANGFGLVSNADMGAIIMAVRAHIAMAFAKEADVLAAIDAGNVTTTVEIDTAFA